MDHLQIKGFVDFSIEQVEKFRGIGHNVDAHKCRVQAMEQLIKHIGTSRDVFMTAPDYVVMLCRKLDKCPPVDITLSP